MKFKRVEFQLDESIYTDLLVMSIELDERIATLIRESLIKQLDDHKKKSEKFTELRTLVLTRRKKGVKS
jgi:hypothetical protein